MNYRLSAAALVLLPIACRAQFSNVSDGRTVYGSISFLDYASGQQTWLSDQHIAPNPGAWQDTLVVPLQTAIGNGTATGHLNAEPLSPVRIAGEASAMVSLTANNANMRADGWAYGRLQASFDLASPTPVHIGALLNGSGAEVWIMDINGTNLVYLRTGESGFPVNVSDTISLGAGRWTFTGQANVSQTFAGQAGTATPTASGTFALTVLCYPNCDGSTAAPVLNVNDFACFLNRFAAGDAYANCDGSTLPPTLNVLDFACFLNRFAAGCP